MTDLNHFQFTVDSENLRSMTALQKIGAIKEGLQQQCRIRSDGSVRDHLVFSVIKSEWAMVKTNLKTRVGSSVARR
jgi:N-acetyltransferase